MSTTFFIPILRNLWKNRINSIINVLGLTLGLTSCLFLYIYLKYEHTFDTHQPMADQIYRVNITQEYPNRTLRLGVTESMLGTAIRNEFTDLEAVIQTFGPSSGLVSIHPGTHLEEVGLERGWRIMTPARPYNGKWGGRLASALQALGLYRVQKQGSE